MPQKTASNRHQLARRHPLLEKPSKSYYEVVHNRILLHLITRHKLVLSNTILHPSSPSHCCPSPLTIVKLECNSPPLTDTICPPFSCSSPSWAHRRPYWEPITTGRITRELGHPSPHVQRNPLQKIGVTIIVSFIPHHLLPLLVTHHNRLSFVCSPPASSHVAIGYSSPSLTKIDHQSRECSLGMTLWLAKSDMETR